MKTEDLENLGFAVCNKPIAHPSVAEFLLVHRSFCCRDPDKHPLDLPFTSIDLFPLSLIRHTSVFSVTRMNPDDL